MSAHGGTGIERPGLADRTVFVTGDVISAPSDGSVSRRPILTKPFSFDRMEEAVIAVMRGTPHHAADRSHVPR